MSHLAFILLRLFPLPCSLASSLHPLLPHSLYSPFFLDFIFIYLFLSTVRTEILERFTFSLFFFFHYLRFLRFFFFIFFLVFFLAPLFRLFFFHFPVMSSLLCPAFTPSSVPFCFPFSCTFIAFFSIPASFICHYFL